MEIKEQPRPRSETEYCRLHAGNWLQILAGLILPILCLILAALLFGCSHDATVYAEDEGAHHRHGGTLRFLQERIDNFDPVYAEDSHESIVLAQIYEGLVSLDGRLGVRPCLAESWVITPDGKLYTFILRGDVRFHDGRPLTAQAAVQSLSRSIGSVSQGYSCLKSIEGAEELRQGAREHVTGLEAIGRDTVRVRLTEPSSSFLPSLAMIPLRINLLPKDGRHLEVSPVGTGPFSIVRRTVDGDIHLAGNEEYWGGRAYLDTLQFLASAGVTGEEKIALMLKREIHVTSGGEWERELLAGKAGCRFYPELDSDGAPVGFGYLVDPRLCGLEVDPFGFRLARLDKVWFAEEKSLAERVTCGSSP